MSRRILWLISIREFIKIIYTIVYNLNMCNKLSIIWYHFEYLSNYYQQNIKYLNLFIPRLIEYSFWLSTWLSNYYYQNLTNNDDQRFLVSLNFDSSWRLKYKIQRQNIIYYKGVKVICGGKIKHVRNFMPKRMLQCIYKKTRICTASSGKDYGPTAFMK